jgi:hypothetical protein
MTPPEQEDNGWNDLRPLLEDKKLNSLAKNVHASDSAISGLIMIIAIMLGAVACDVEGPVPPTSGGVIEPSKHAATSTGVGVTAGVGVMPVDPTTATAPPSTYEPQVTQQGQETGPGSQQPIQQESESSHEDPGHQEQPDEDSDGDPGHQQPQPENEHGDED